MSRRVFALGFVLTLTAGSVAGIALGLVAVAAAQRLSGMLGAVEWSEDE